MKNLRRTNLLGVMLVTLWGLAPHCLAGDKIQNGGQKRSNEVTSILNDISRSAQWANLYSYSESQLKKMDKKNPAQAMLMKRKQKMLETFLTEIPQISYQFTCDQLIGEDGENRDALNDPDQKVITINEYSWMRNYSSISARAELVLHETLSVLGLEAGDNFTMTKEFLTDLRKQVTLDFKYLPKIEMAYLVCPKEDDYLAPTEKRLLGKWNCFSPDWLSVITPIYFTGSEAYPYMRYLNDGQNLKYHASVDRTTDNRLEFSTLITLQDQATLPLKSERTEINFISEDLISLSLPKVAESTKYGRLYHLTSYTIDGMESLTCTRD